MGKNHWKYNTEFQGKVDIRQCMSRPRRPYQTRTKKQANAIDERPYKEGPNEKSKKDNTSIIRKQAAASRDRQDVTRHDHRPGRQVK